MAGQAEHAGRAGPAGQAERPAGRGLTLPGFYNAVMGPQGFGFPAHLIPAAASLADNRIGKLMTILGPGSGKSMLLSVVYPAFLLGKDPTMTVLSVSAGEGLPQGFMHAAMELIEHSPHYKRLFPAVQKDAKAGWSTERGMYLAARTPGNPDANYFACGLTSKTLTGKHAQLIILDDIHDADNSATPQTCDKVISRYYNNLIGRADPRGARFLLAGRRWTEWDIYGHLMQAGDWVCMRLPAERPQGSPLFYDVLVPPDLSCCWTEGAGEEVESPNPKYRQFRAYYGVDPAGQGFYWPTSDMKRSEYFSVKRNRPAEAASVYQGEPGGRAAGVFLESDFQTVALGRWPRLAPALLPDLLRTPGCRIVQAWDTAHGKDPKHDYSVCMTGVLVPCHAWHHGESQDAVGLPDPHYDVYVVDVLRDRLDFGELVEQVRQQARHWGPSFIAIEKTVGSTALIQSLATSLPIVPVQAKDSKHARTVVAVGPGTASVQGWMRQGRVFFWAEAAWLPDLIREFLNFSGDGSGFDDQCDSGALLISQAILLGSGRAMLPSAAGEAGIDQARLATLESQTARPRQGLAGLMLIQDLAAGPESRPATANLPGITPTALPGIQVCANCRRHDRSTSMCAILGVKTIAMDSCGQWALGQQAVGQ